MGVCRYGVLCTKDWIPALVFGLHRSTPIAWNKSHCLTVPFKELLLHQSHGPYLWKESNTAANEICVEDAV